MLLRKNGYYDRFSCLAGSCPDSCCHEWEVLVDPDAAEKYRCLPGPLGDRLRQVLKIDEEGDAYLTIQDSRCPMWRADGLCSIQAEFGHDALCKTCREFPRLRHDYGDFVELGLELSCPEAARLLLDAPPVDPVTEVLDKAGEAEYDPVDMEILLRTREKMLTLLANGTYSIEETLALGLLYAYRAQAELDGAPEEPFLPEDELAFGRSLAKPGGAQALVEFYKSLEILTQRWRNLLDSPREAAWDPRLLRLARYGVERYWLQAVSDFDLVGRAKMVICACILVRQLGGDLVQTAQLYGKEIENSAENAEAIWEAAYSHPALTDDRLLGILLEETL